MDLIHTRKTSHFRSYDEFTKAYDSSHHHLPLRKFTETRNASQQKIAVSK